MDSVLLEFMEKTGADAGLARDILEGQKWNLEVALRSYDHLYSSSGSNVKNAARHNKMLNGCLTSTSLKLQPPTKNDQRPILNKAKAINYEHEISSKKLSRGISKDNYGIVSRARTEAQQDYDDNLSKTKAAFFVETPVYTFTLPDLSIHPDDFRTFLEKDLIETSTLVSLENAGRLNWWAEIGPCQRLWPLATSGDGNCLLHAASLGMWGFHDRLLTLRKALHATLTNGPFREAFWRRWRWQQTLQNKKAEFVYTEGEWTKEWENILRLSSTEPRNHPGHKVGAASVLDVVEEEECDQHHIYESLEEIHVLALAHVLRRPIIVVADTLLKAVSGEPLAPISFGGIYLPLEIPPSECHRSPLVLTYDAAHFSALVNMENEADADAEQANLAVIPVVDPELKLLTIQFCVDPGTDFGWGRDEFDGSISRKLVLTDKDQLGLLGEYLDIRNIVIFNHPQLGNCLSNGDNTRCSYESDDGLFPDGKNNKTSRQVNSVAKQFGSIGKSVSKKIKKNFGNFTRTVARSGSFRSKNVVDIDFSGNDIHETGKTGYYHVNDPTMVAALLHTNKRHLYQEEMIKNYLSSAKERFIVEKQVKNAPTLDRQQRRLSSGLGLKNGLVNCINPGCDLYGTVATSYLCKSCFQSQKRKENEMVEHQAVSPPTLTNLACNVPSNTLTLVGSSSPKKPLTVPAKHVPSDYVSWTGRSKFYTQSESKKESGDGIEQVMPAILNSPSKDPTVYLSNSVFFNDGNSPNISTTMSAEAPSSTCISNAATMYVTGNSMFVNRPCRAENCAFFGNSCTDYFCSKCFKDRQLV